MLTCTLHAHYMHTYVCTYVCYVHLHVKLNMFLLQVYTHIILLVCIYSSVCEEGFKTDVHTYICTCVLIVHVCVETHSHSYKSTTYILLNVIYLLFRNHSFLAGPLQSAHVMFCVSPDCSVEVALSAITTVSS